MTWRDAGALVSHTYKYFNISLDRPKIRMNQTGQVEQPPIHITKDDPPESEAKMFVSMKLQN
jgi:hypothetical protein